MFNIFVQYILSTMDSSFEENNLQGQRIIATRHMEATSHYFLKFPATFRQSLVGLIVVLIFWELWKKTVYESLKWEPPHNLGVLFAHLCE